MRIALIVYVKNYKDKNIVNLKKTSDDAINLSGFLKEALPEDYRFQVAVLDNPSNLRVRRELERIKGAFQEAEEKANREGREERNLFLFFFSGHAFGCSSTSQVLLCANAYGVDSSTELIGGIGPATLDSFQEGLEHTDVVFLLDACRNPLKSKKGDDDAVCGCEQFRTVGDVNPNADESSARELRIFTCANKQKAADDGLTMSVAIDIWRGKLRAGEEILLDSTFTENWGELLNKKRRGNKRQTPVFYGLPIRLAPGVKKNALGRSTEQELLGRLQKELEETKRQNADLASKISASATQSTSRQADYERLLKELEAQKRKIAELERKDAANKPTASPVSPSAVWNGTRAGERREIQIKDKKYGFCWIPPGSFMMGSPESEKGRCGDETQHEVRLTKGFWMLETPVTQGLWTSVTGNNPSYFCSTGGGASSVEGMDTTNFPVENVSWNDCREFLKKLNRMLNMSFKLPTEAQWEYACRAGTTTPYNFGRSLNGDQANCDGNYPYGRSFEGTYLERTCAVKSYASNEWNLYDMHGNVDEWCSDWYGDYPEGSVVDPIGATNASARVVRGGGWGHNAEGCRSAYRNYSAPADRYYFVGFRLLLE